MQDIDFDELDRAVSSAINPAATAPAAPQSEEKPVIVERETIVPERSTPVRPTVSPAARRSSGRFMDVVHPSSDMRPSVTSPARPVEVKKPEPVAAAPVEKPANDGFNWPDPLEVAKDDQSEPDIIDQVIEENKAETGGMPPLETPFLPEAKVEKRPLGAFSDAKPALDLSEALNEEPVTDAPAPDFSSTTGEAPANLESIDETKLEASEESLIGAPESADTSPAVDTAAAPAPTEPAIEPVTEAELKVETPAASFDPPASTSLGAASIPQQYKEQPSTAEQPSGAIYDTEAYHQPLAHPQKKKSGLWVIVWILGLIVLGGGLGAALYFYVLPML